MRTAIWIVVLGLLVGAGVALHFGMRAAGKVQGQADRLAFAAEIWPAFALDADVDMLFLGGERGRYGYVAGNYCYRVDVDPDDPVMQQMWPRQDSPAGYVTSPAYCTDVYMFKVPRDGDVEAEKKEIGRRLASLIASGGRNAEMPPALVPALSWAASRKTWADADDHERITFGEEEVVLRQMPIAGRSQPPATERRSFHRATGVFAEHRAVVFAGSEHDADNWPCVEHLFSQTLGITAAAEAPVRVDQGTPEAVPPDWPVSDVQLPE